jgi:hypothetical protein
VRRKGGQRICPALAAGLFRCRRTLHETVGPVEHLRVIPEVCGRRWAARSGLKMGLAAR